MITDHIHRKGSSDYYQLDRHIFRWKNDVNCDPRLVENRVLPPDCVDDLLTRRAFDESLGLTNDRHFNGVANSIVQVFILLPSKIQYDWISARVNWPASNRGRSQVKEVITILAQTLHSQDLAEMCPGAGKSRCREVVVTDEVHVVQEKTKHDRLVACVLEIAIFLSQRTNQRIGQVRSR